MHALLYQIHYQPSTWHVDGCHDEHGWDVAEFELNFNIIFTKELI